MGREIITYCSKESRLFIFLIITNQGNHYYINQDIMHSGGLTIVPIVLWHGPPAEGVPDLPTFLGRGRVDSTVLIYS